ncbi:MAG: PIG-L deacetylase family protein [Nitrospirota bacterium]
MALAVNLRESKILEECDLIPYCASEPVGNRVLVLAPHPDDETLGCGGSLRLLSRAGTAVKVIFITNGEKADPAVKNRERYAAIREEEALKALNILDLSDYEFLRFPDRQLYEYMDKAKEMIAMIIENFNPDALYSPSSIELNPDHRASAEIALKLQRRFGFKILFYELTTPLRPNILVDITKAFRIKKKAIKAYRTQLNIIDYLRLIIALNTYRTFTLGKNVKFAEAFLIVSRDNMESHIFNN